MGSFEMVKNPLGCFCPILLSPFINRLLQRLQLPKSKKTTMKGTRVPCKGTRWWTHV